MTQPEALRLAEFYEALAEEPPKSPDNSNIRATAAELRRLSAENAELWKEREEPHKTIEMYVRECNRLERERDEARRTVREAHEAGARLTAQRDSLLEALKMMRDKYGEYACRACDRADAAIKAVEGEKT